MGFLMVDFVAWFLTQKLIARFVNPFPYQYTPKPWLSRESVPHLGGGTEVVAMLGGGIPWMIIPAIA